MAAWSILLIGFAAAGHASITLPLEGYCRPGRYFPIRVDGSDAVSDRVFSADGCVSTMLHPAGGGVRIVPMLVVGFPKSLQFEGTTPVELHLLDNQSRLIATTSSDLSPAAVSFPGDRLISIRVDAADPLSGPIAAWESLDAILLDSSNFSRVTDSQRSALLAGGVVLIALGDSIPDRRWPWQHRGSVWVLSFAPAGLIGQVVSEDIYSPTFTWEPGWSTMVRGQVMGIGGVLVLITIALVLYPRRWTLWICLLLSLVTGAGIVAWRRSLGSISFGGGDIVIAKAGLVQRDQWVFERTREAGKQNTPWIGSTHPIFASQTALAGSDLKLVVTSNVDVSFVYTMAADHTMAFVRREVMPGGVPAVKLPIQSPMLEAAKDVYLQQGDQIVGEAPGASGRWGSVVISNQGDQTSQEK